MLFRSCESELFGLQFSEGHGNWIDILDSCHVLTAVLRVGATLPSPRPQSIVTDQRVAWLPGSLSYSQGPDVSSARALAFGNSCVLTFQLQQEIKDWSKSHAELSEQIKAFEQSQKNLEVALTHKDDNINVSSFS